MAIGSKIWFEVECMSKSEQCTKDTLKCRRKKEISKCKRQEGKVDLKMIRLLLQEQSVATAHSTFHQKVKIKNCQVTFDYRL